MYDTLKYTLSQLYSYNLFKYSFNDKISIKISDLNFKSQVCIAGGYDKNAKFINGVSNMGAGAIEIGTVTPLPQEAIKDVKKHVKVFWDDASIINKIGCKNDGIQVIKKRIIDFKNKNDESIRPVIGVSIGYNNINFGNTDKIISDYSKCASELNGVADYIAINVSSPNVPGMRELQNKSTIRQIIDAVMNNANTNNVFVKLAPELDDEYIFEIIQIIEEMKALGIIAFNTYQHTRGQYSGGLSGMPIFEKSLEKFKRVSNMSNKIVKIASGGIFTGDDAYEYIKYGASLVQVYTSMLFRGPFTIRKINKELLRSMEIMN